jgi:hypothetical protein
MMMRELIVYNPLAPEAYINPAFKVHGNTEKRKIPKTEKFTLYTGKKIPKNEKPKNEKSSH